MKDLVLLMQLGGARDHSEVFGFTYRLLSDPEIIRLPDFSRKLLAYTIAALRNPVMRTRYKRIGGSPIMEITTLQARGLSEELHSRQSGIQVLYAARHSSPFPEDVLGGLDVDRCLVLPLFPHYSFTTVKTCVDAVLRAVKKTGFKGECRAIEGFYSEPGYIQAQASLILERLDEVPFPKAVLFSAHGLPRAHIEAGDPYPRQVARTVTLISRYLPNDVETYLGYQSRMSSRWIGPSIEDALKRIFKIGTRSVVVVPISFVSEHFETLYELDIQYQKKAKKMGFDAYLRVPALNTYPPFIKALADIVVKRFEEW